MKFNKNVFLISIVVTAVSFYQWPSLAVTSAKSSSEKYSLDGQERKLFTAKKNDANNLDKEKSSQVVNQNQLAEAACIFKEKPNEGTFNALWQTFVSFVQKETALRKDPFYLFKSWKILTEAGLQINELSDVSNSFRVYSFNHLNEDNKTFVPPIKYALLQWKEQNNVIAKFSNGKNKSTKSNIKEKSNITNVILKTQLINLPPTVDVQEVSLLPHTLAVAKSSVSKSFKVSTKGKKFKKVCNSKTVINSANHYLALSGRDWQSEHIWLGGFKQTPLGWIYYPQLFHDVPLFLVQTSAAKTKISGNTLVLTLGGTNGYDLSMPFVDDHFAFNTKEAQDSANGIANQFLLSIENKQPELAKLWLSDPKLVSIPNYLGLFNRSPDGAPLRLINMPPPLCGGSRFRLISGNKDDLIIDITKIKNQWLIKGLFIAPALVHYQHNDNNLLH